MIRSGIIFIFLLLAAPSDSQLCWKKFDPSTCKYTAISELGISRFIGPSAQARRFRPTLDLELNLGLSKIIEKKWGVGVYGFGIASVSDGGAIQAGIRSRLSYFLSNRYEIGISPGIILHHSRSSNDHAKGFSVETSFAWKNRIGFFSRFDFLQLENEKNSVQINVGIKTGGPRAALGASGGAVLGAIGLLVLVLALF